MNIFQVLPTVYVRFSEDAFVAVNLSTVSFSGVPTRAYNRTVLNNSVKKLCK